MVRVSPFTPLKAFSFQSWNSMMCDLQRHVAQLEVRLLYRVLLREHGEGITLRSLEGLQLPVLEVNDVRAQAA